MQWDDFYDRFYDWADSTKVSRISSIESFGDEDSVYEVAMEYAYLGNKECTRFLKRAIYMGVTFTAPNMMELIYSVEEGFISELVKHNNSPYTVDQLDELSCYVPESELKALAKKSNIAYKTVSEEQRTPPKNKPGFFAAMAGLFSGSKPTHSHQEGHCDGDCANCPAHYGYRYGRWYYGHGHQYGCELGGNGGASGKCNRD